MPTELEKLEDRSLFAVYDWTGLRWTNESAPIVGFGRGSPWISADRAKNLIITLQNSSESKYVGWYIYIPPGNLLKLSRLLWKVWKHGEPIMTPNQPMLPEWAYQGEGTW